MTPLRARPGRGRGASSAPGTGGEAPASHQGSGRPDEALPTLDLLRRLTDGYVLAELVRAPATRAALAKATGLSKPTVSESVRRLSERGVLHEGALTQGGRGRAGTLVEVDDTAGAALAIHAGAGEVTAEVLDVRGQVRGRHTLAVDEPVREADLRGALDAAINEAFRAAGDIAQAPLRSIAVSVADPVDPHTGRVVDLPGSPFLIGDADLPGVLRPHLAHGGRLAIDNNVNWSALAELDLGVARDLSDVIHIHLGRGIGAAIVIDGRVVQGARGTAGEIAQLPWTGNATLVRRLSDLGLAVPGQWRLDLDLAERILRPDSTDPARDRFVEAIALACAGVVTFLDPQALILGGPLAANDWLREAIAARVNGMCALPIDVRHAQVDEAPLSGARRHAAADLTDLLLDA